MNTAWVYRTIPSKSGTASGIALSPLLFVVAKDNIIGVLINDPASVCKQLGCGEGAASRELGEMAARLDYKTRNTGKTQVMMSSKFIHSGTGSTDC